MLTEPPEHTEGDAGDITIVGNVPNVGLMVCVFTQPPLLTALTE